MIDKIKTPLASVTLLHEDEQVLIKARGKFKEALAMAEQLKDNYRGDRPVTIEYEAHSN